MSFKKVRLHLTDMQTRPRKKNFDFSIFFSFFLTDLIFPERADKNMNCQVIPSPLRKCTYIRPICKPSDEKKNRFFLIFLFFLTDLILPERANKNMYLQVISSPLRKCTYIRWVCKPGDEKKIPFFHIFLYYFNRLNITRSGRQKYVFIRNFKSFKKMHLHPADMQTRRR